MLFQNHSQKIPFQSRWWKRPGAERFLMREALGNDGL